MQRLAQRIWSPASRWHVGDLAWDRFQHVGREAEWPTAIWDEGAWGWIWLPGELGLCVDPQRPELVDEVLDWFESTATGHGLTVYFLDPEEHIAAELAQWGYQAPDEDPCHLHMMRDLRELPVPSLPEGFKLRHLQGAQ